MTARPPLPTGPLRAPERSLPAKTRFDEFEIERVLAQSSFAVVYRAYDHALKLHVAIKEYLPDALALRSADTHVVLRARAHAERYEQGLQAFIGEAQTLARCDHPSLLRIVRVLQCHGTAYRVMRLTPGPTLLAQRREQAVPPSADAVHAWLDGLLGAIEALHEEGCVHGAVAPGNILLLHGGRPLLLDMDAVRGALISDRTQSMMAALEPCFEPPEQRAPAAEIAMGPWTDLYSLAATLHFCISGQLPVPPSGAVRDFEALGAVWQRLQAAQPEVGEAPAWLSVLDACLADPPQARPQNVAQVREMLDARSAARRTSAPRATPRQVLTLPESTAVPAAPPAKAEPASVHIQPPPRTAAAPALTPAAPPPVDPDHARVIADLDQTFAFIAAQAHEEAQAPAKPVEAAAPPEPDPAAQGAAGTAGLSSRQRLWLAGVAAVALLLLMGGTVVWMLKTYDAGLLGGNPVGGTTAVPWQAPPAEAAPAPPSGTPLIHPPPGAGRSAAAPPPADAKPAEAPPKARAPTSPRQACAGKERYALLRCMETQCASKAWSKHEQCVRLRKDRKL